MVGSIVLWFPALVGVAVLWFPAVVGVIELCLVGVVLLWLVGVWDAGIVVTGFLLLDLVVAGVVVGLPGVLELFVVVGACAVVEVLLFPCTTN